MALTNFAALTNEELTVWARQVWTEARKKSFINRFAGTGMNALCQRITELKKSEKGARAVITLVNELAGDGVMGDSTLENNEEAMLSDDDVVQLDQLRHAVRSQGRMAEQRSVVQFREQAKDKLAYWLADRVDQLAFLTLAGIPYTYHTNGALRQVLATNRNLNDLAFASDVTAPSSQRHLRWDAATKDLADGDTDAVTAADVITYDSLVLLKSVMKERHIRPLMGDDGEEVYAVFMPPRALARLKLDEDFKKNLREALPRAGGNPIFKGAASYYIDGLIITEYRHVFNTLGATTGSKWGTNGDVDGARISVCGAQALAMADIGNAIWEEDQFDYKNQQGISVGKILGFKKPTLKTSYSGGVKQDFGVMSFDVAL